MPTMDAAIPKKTVAECTGRGFKTEVFSSVLHLKPFQKFTTKTHCTSTQCSVANGPFTHVS